MMTDVEMTPDQQLALERMECVCRECYKLPTQRHHRNYCTRCGKPFAWPAGTTPLPRAEALAQVRAEERARCADMARQVATAADHYEAQVVARTARGILKWILEE